MTELMNPRLRELMNEAETRAANFEGAADTHVTALDTVSCRYHADWASDNHQFFHNWVRIDQARAFELTCGR